MKSLFILGVVAAIYFFLIRETPVAAVKEVVTAAEVAPLVSGPKAPVAAPSSGLRGPLDRTHAALEKNRARTGGDEF